MSIEYNSNYAFNESKVAVCERPDLPDMQQLRHPPIRGNEFDQYSLSASLRAIHVAASRRGYTVVWVEPMLDVFLVRTDLLCPGPEGAPPLESFAHMTSLPMHKQLKEGSTSKKQSERWVVDYR